MEMRHLLFWVGSMVLVVPGCSSGLTGPKAVGAVLGSSVSVTCSYDQRYQKNRKYWCRRMSESNCREIVGTTGSEQPMRHNRVYIMDSHSQNHFTIRMTSLTSNDSGMYNCAVARKGGVDLFAPVNVTVLVAPQNTDNLDQGGSFHKSAFHSISYQIYMSFLIMICSKTSIFLTMVLAIFWMHRRSRQHSDKVTSETHA